MQKKYNPNDGYGYRPLISPETKARLKSIAALTGAMVALSPLYATPARPQQMARQSPIVEAPMRMSGAESDSLFDGKRIAYVGEGNLQDRFERGREIHDMIQAWKDMRAKRKAEAEKRKAEEKAQQKTATKRMCVNDSMDEEAFRLTFMSADIQVVAPYDPIAMPVMFTSFNFSLLDKASGKTSSFIATRHTATKFKASGKDILLKVVKTDAGDPPKCVDIALKK